MQNELLQTGLADQSIALTRVGFTGGVSTSYIDLTPYTGDSPNDPVLKVRGRAVPVIKAKISGIEKSIDSPAANDICNTTQEAVDAIYSFYAIVRLLIGGLSADPPPKTTETVGKDADGNIHGYIGTSIPGTRKINLKPLFDRWNRLAKIEKQRKDLLDQIETLPRTRGASPALSKPKSRWPGR